MASTSKRVIWKGAISFGLVHIPIALHSATSDQRLDFDWLDKRSMDPIGYKRVNKRTGKEVQRENIVKGIAYDDGQYVVLSSEEIAAAYPKITQTIEIEAFVAAADIPFVYLERPYYIAPINKAAKVYALLREVLHKSGKVGVAKVVIQTKQHLALLAPVGPTLVLELLRWGDEVRSWDELELPPVGIKAAGLTTREMQMAEQLVAEMSQPWKAENFVDTFKEQILKLVDQKIKAGDTEEVSAVETEVADTSSAKIYDLTEMLQRSLNKGGAKPVKTPRAKASAKTSAKKAPAGKPKSTLKRKSA